MKLTNSALARADEMWTMTADEPNLSDCLTGSWLSANAPVTVVRGSDRVFQYSIQLLRLVLFYQEFADAIREGDGT